MALAKSISSFFEECDNYIDSSGHQPRVTQTENCLRLEPGGHARVLYNFSDGQRRGWLYGQDAAIARRESITQATIAMAAFGEQRRRCRDVAVRAGGITGGPGEVMCACSETPVSKSREPVTEQERNICSNDMSTRPRECDARMASLRNEARVPIWVSR